MTTALDLLKKLISCKSVTPFSDGAIEYLAEELQKIGFTVDLVTFPEGKWKTREDDPINYSVQNLYAKITIGDAKASTLAFCGHLDVVPEGSITKWESAPFTPTIKDVDGIPYIFGRGAEDMKGGVAAFFGAVQSFLVEYPNFNGSIVFLITTDEEDVAINGIKPLIEYVSNKIKIDGCIVGEASSVNVLGDFIKLGSRGSLEFNLTVQGTQGHVAYPENTVNPVSIMAKLVCELKNLKLDNGNDDFQPSNLEIVSIDTNNKTYNLIPATCTAIGNIRYNTEHTVESLKNIINTVVNKYPQANITFGMHPSNSYCASKHSKIYECTKNAIKTITNVNAEPDTKGGTSDARYILPYTDVVEFGLSKRTLHQSNENISIKEFEDLQKIYKEILVNYFSKK